ncbi:Cof-type HAD-IIB family hydrolase [Vagococcus sp. DIV0080]|uniref:Cof-type HAD-IIB family hydrolase n=1 Tax=Candidatus Vagococcus giribetii TaxID=2230876 RepID=A0ABS3HUG2_9ENTE|nr:Cof-type HAD-IIB family hydrolase [Vagococcus sp. DIV0080]MBO0477384.1 Cof-type HAD-IIB family hydrolase [Vagococcus sp. DIV0080]
MIKAAFFDIDGTLLSSNGEVLASTKRAIEKLHQEDVLCCIASGRGPKSIQSLIGQLPMDAYVLYNGQICFSHEVGIFENPFSHETLRRLAEFGDNENKQMIFGSRKEFYGSQSMQLGQRKLIKHLYHLLPDQVSAKELEKWLKKWQILPQKENKFMSLPIFDRPVYQCVMLSPESEQERLEALFPDCKFTRSNPYSVDIIPQGGSKIVGIHKVLEHYELDVHEAIAFGDSWNDLEMLKGIGIGVAMGNAPDDVKEEADYVTETNDRDGIYQALVHHQVIR